ncbi:hydroxyacid dehydrogenase [[Clostridium] symbiosum]|uniref:four-carbon acid sugar kinase family protein n=1 Tax=Clostridium symbiosum TaxID=1512 RepID=UPI00210E12E1|nr:four-carbon acid sugar kinase family protein [[Clostridium] symbiosum]MCQ4988415.1 hydroxyacid dehydrogenase [[Clostridium] symbiosum]
MALIHKNSNGAIGKIVVLDDDPTGVQTVSGVSVYTDWSLDSIREGFAEREELFFILTNSRSFTQDETVRVHREISSRLVQVSKETGLDFLVICRGDSTLRGHYLVEPETVAATLDGETHLPVDAEIYCPCFFECGRITEGNVHYLMDGAQKIPVSQTEFAKDKTFGFNNSDMGKYIEEKTEGRYRAGDCLFINAGQPDTEQRLIAASGRRKIVVNASDYKSLKKFCETFRLCIMRGKRFVVRSASSFVKAVGDFPEQPYLRREQLRCTNSKNGGIILIGSHVSRTTAQLANLKASGLPVQMIEFQVDNMLQAGGLEKEADRVLALMEKAVARGEDTAVYTSRQVLAPAGMSKEEILKLSVSVSDALTGLISRLKTAPSYIVAKGGITSSDVGTKALRVRRARVMGQVKPGVPVWMTGPECRFPQMPYIIFPGNVGEEGTLTEIAKILRS